MMGRVYGAMSMAFQAAQAAGNAVGAALVLLLAYRNMAYLCAAVLAFTALYLGTRRAWRVAEPLAREVSSPGTSPDPRPGRAATTS